MGVALGLIAIALAGAAGEPKAGGENVQIQYTVCFMETEGMGWREAVFTRLTPVTRQGAATVWTAPGIVKPRLLQRAIKDQGALPVQTPAYQGMERLAGALLDPLRSTVSSPRSPGMATIGPPKAKPETVRTGPVGTMAGRKMDQGVLVQLVLEDTEVRAVHRLPLGGSTEPKSSPETKKAALRDENAPVAGLLPVQDGGDALSPLTSFLEGRRDVLGSILCSLPNLNEEPQLLTIPVFDGPAPSGTISEVRIRWQHLDTRRDDQGQAPQPGRPADRSRERSTADIMTLMATGWFSDVKASYAPFPGEKNILYFTVHETPAAHAYRAAVTHNQGLGTAKSTASSDCACEKDDVIQAHLEHDRHPSRTRRQARHKGDEVSPVSIEVPEIASQEIAGEWLIPKDGILLVSFGPHTVADKEGKAVIRERLAIVEAEGVADGAVQRTGPATGRLRLSDSHGTGRNGQAASQSPRPSDAGNLPGTLPALPSRSIPQGIHADGTPAELPPLPADDTEDPSSSESAEPRPSPQIRKPQPAAQGPRPTPR